MTDPRKHSRKQAGDGKVPKPEIDPARRQMGEVLTAIKAACQAKGWKQQVTSHDRRAWRYATVSVSRTTPTDGLSQRITGNLEVIVDDGVQVSCQKTSFHGQGLKDLHDAVMRELGRLPWIAPPEHVNRKVSSPIEVVKRILDGFPRVAAQLTQR